MTRAAFIAAAAIGVSALQARADTGTGYSLIPGSTMTNKQCLPPCLCAYLEQSGPLSGWFTLTPTAPGVASSTYTVSGLSGWAMVGGVPVTLAGYGTYTTGGLQANQQQLVLDLLVNGTAEHFDSGLVPVDPQHPFPEIAITLFAQSWTCGQDWLTLDAMPDPTVCYANCDGSVTPPVLNVQDFQCFLSRFAAGDPYANCDGSTVAPVLNILDFQCFVNQFLAGCPGSASVAQ